jgi:hypothetical protein
MRFEIDHADLAHLLRWVQDEVVARRQLLDLGATPNDIERLLRRRDLLTVHPGVYVAHSGRLSRAQREWVGVLAAWPAALTLDSALPDPVSPLIHVAVELGRQLQMPDRMVAHRTAHLRERGDWRAAPPRVRLEHATVDVMSRLIAQGNVAAAYARLTQVAHTRRTSPEQILRALAHRPRVPGRATLEGLLVDLRDGACSVLERGYLHRVERAHGLPRGTRQRRSTATGRVTYVDVRYERWGTIVELDGVANHDGAAARDRDALRDLSELAMADAVTARVTYGLVFRDQCRTALWLGRLLRRRGWPGRVTPCAECR